MNRTRLALSFLAASSALLVATLSRSSHDFELPPGRVHNPAGNQNYQKIVYNPVLDNYLCLYTSGDGGVQTAMVGHLSPTATGPTGFTNPTAISGAIGVSHVNGAFNPDDGTFLIVYRTVSAAISGQYLTSDGTTIGSAFSIGSGGTGFGPNVAYSPVSGRYVVTWEQLGSGTVRYRVIDGDSTSATPAITAAATLSIGLSDGLSYGSVADKFLVTYVKDLGGTAKGNVYGRFISSNGLSVGTEFAIATGNKDQAYPRVGYAPSTNQWMVVYENWNCGGCSVPHVRAAYVSSTGAVVKGFNVAATSAWDQPGPVTYNPITDTLITGWRSAFSDTNIQVKAGEFDPLNGTLVRPTVLLSDVDDNQGAGLEGVAPRPDPANPQATFIWRVGPGGGDGLHVGIMNLPPPPPDTMPPADVTDLSATPTAGGNPVSATAIASTAPFPSSTDMTKTTDGDPATYWQTPSRTTMTTESITWDLGSQKTLSQVSLQARSTGNLFPVDYQIQVSNDNVNFTTVFSQTAAAPPLGAWVDHALPDPSARYVRLWITKTKLNASGKYSAQVAEVEISEAAPGESLLIEWTAPGDDGNVGRASSYDLRWSTNLIDNGNFASATSIPTPAPALAGTAESLVASGFPSEDIVFLALKTTDNEPFTSGLSNVVEVTTPGVPPAPVTGFAASNPTGNSVQLTWLPSGDDGNSGNATTYDIRYSTAPITSDAAFAAAASVLRPATNPKPAQESYTLGGLANQTGYYFAIKALDDVGYASVLATGVSATTLDAIAPSAISDLSVAAAPPTLVKVTAPAIDASGQTTTETMTKATDGNLSSYWSTPGRPTQQNEFITLDAGAIRSIGRVRLRSRSGGALFPEDLEIQLSNDNASWSTVAARTGLPSTVSTWHDIDFGPFTGRYVRVFITKTRLSGGGLYIAQIAEIEVYESVMNHQMVASWTEPGDDLAIGTATSFDLRYAASSIDNDAEFDAATPIVGEPLPQGPGSLASFSFMAPAEGVTLHFRMRVLDDVGNASLSNSESATTTAIPPAAVSDLLAFDPTSTSVDLSWTATGDDGVSGMATLFDVRYSTSIITAGNFLLATQATGEPVPAAPGTLQGMTISGLSPSTTYYFAMKVRDEALTFSEISNVVSAATDAPDVTDPGNVTDLRGSAPFTIDLLLAPASAASSVESGSAGFDKATDGVSTSYWGTLPKATQAIEWITLDTGSLHDIGEVRLLSRPAGAVFPEDLEIQVSADNVSFTTVRTATGLPATQGLLHTFTFPAASGRYVRVYITKTRKNGANLYAAQIAEIQVYEANFFPGPVTLNWTAPGDDGPNGQASSYDVRFSTTPITSLATFNAATPASGEPAPKASGSLETFAVNLPPGTYYFALRTADEAGNQSGVSNVPVIVVP